MEDSTFLLSVIIFLMICWTIGFLYSIVHLHLFVNEIKTHIMATKQEFVDLITQIQDSVANVADDIRRLTDQIGTGGLTEAEEADVLAQLRSAADQLSAVTAQTPEPSPEP